MGIGGAILLVGIIVLISSISSYAKTKKEQDQVYNQQLAQYEVDYAEWEEKWRNGDASLSDQPTHPSMVNSSLEGEFNNTAKLLLSIGLSLFILMAGVTVTIVGARPYLTKLGLKHKKETLDYAGKDMTDVGTKVVDIAAPVVNKVTEDITVPTMSKVADGVVIPAVEKIKKSAKNDDSSKAFCRHCGKSILADSKFCNHCGQEQ